MIGSVLTVVGYVLVLYASVLFAFGPVMYHDEKSRVRFVLKNLYNYKWVILIFMIGVTIVHHAIGG